MNADVALEIHDARAQAGEELPHVAVLAAEVLRLREAMRVMSVNEGRLHAQIAELQTMLARVEALPARWRKEDDESAMHGAADELESALKCGCPCHQIAKLLV